VNLGHEVLTQAKFEKSERVGMFVRVDRIPAIRSFAAAHQASVRYIADVQRGEGVLLAIEFDGRSHFDLGERVAAIPVRGAHSTEHHQGHTFRWLRASVDIEVRAPGRAAVCVGLDLFSAGRSGGKPEIVAVEAPGAAAVMIDLLATSPAAPRRAKIAVSTPDGTARLSLRARYPEQRFPGDARPVALGILMPIAVVPDRECQ
jgi:hypothetical protein